MNSFSKLYEYFWLEDNFFFWFGVNITANLYKGETNYPQYNQKVRFALFFSFKIIKNVSF